MDEGRWIDFGETGRDRGEQGVTFDFAVPAEAGGGLGEVVVVVAGVGDELEGAVVGEGVEEVGEGLGGEVAGGGDAEGTVGGADGGGWSGVCMFPPFAARRMGHRRVGGWLKFVEPGLEAAEEEELGTAERATLAEGVGPAGFEGVADGGDAGDLEGAEDGAEDAGKEVGVFVGVGVGEGDAGGLEAADLGDGFAGDVVGVDLAADGGEGEAGERGAEVLPVGSEEGGDGGGGGGGCTVGEDDVAADAERGVLPGDVDGIGKGRAGGHEGGGGEDAGLMELGDGAVDAGREAEVVGIEDQRDAHASTIARGADAADDGWLSLGCGDALRGFRQRPLPRRPPSGLRMPVRAAGRLGRAAAAAPVAGRSPLAVVAGLRTDCASCSRRIDLSFWAWAAKMEPGTRIAFMAWPE